MCDTASSMVKQYKPIMPQRNWEVHPGRNKFYCNGKIIMARNNGVFLFTFILIGVTSAMFFAFDCPYLYENLSPVIPFIGGWLFLFVMSTLLRTAFSDPGIVPRATAEEAAYIEKTMETTTSDGSYRPPARTKEIVVNGQTVKLKYCFTCKIFRPPRASHCSMCDNCVERFDHHCPWVGNCVGKRNYRFFYLFLVSLSIYCCYLFGFVVIHLVMRTHQPNATFVTAMKESPASILEAIVCFFSVWSIIGLAGFHSYLTASNQTTNEDIKGSFSSRRGQNNFNPYSSGSLCGNCLEVLCGPFQPSLINRQGIVVPEPADSSGYKSMQVTAQPAAHASSPNGLKQQYNSINNSVQVSNVSETDTTQVTQTTPEQPSPTPPMVNEPFEGDVLKEVSEKGLVKLSSV